MIRIDSVVVEEGNEIRALTADVQRIVAAAGYQDYCRARIQVAIDRVNFDGRVVNVNNAVDSSRHGLAYDVLFRLADPVGLEERRAGRIKRDHHAAL
jgi:hypothetical protein